jgi:hypothetical protein
MKLAAALAALGRELQDRGMPFALVGGIAASARGEARFTRDIDVAVVVNSDGEAEELLFWLRGRGYVAVATVEHQLPKRLATARLRDPSGVVCDVLFASSGIEREIVDTAEVTEVFPDCSVPTARVEALLAMKVLASTSERPRDAGDIRAMILANPQFDEERLKAYLVLVEQRGYASGQRLLPKWRKLRKQLGV